MTCFWLFDYIWYQLPVDACGFICLLAPIECSIRVLADLFYSHSNKFSVFYVIHELISIQICVIFGNVEIRQVFVCIFIISDARHMAHDVDCVLQKIVTTFGNLDDAAAQDYLKKLRSRGRYSCDVWS
jgi:hypothetical protein